MASHGNGAERWRPLAAGVLLVGLSVLGFRVAWGGGEVGGGLPLLPHAWNQVMGRGAFGTGAVITALLAVVAFREAVLGVARKGGNGSADPGTEG